MITKDELVAEWIKALRSGDYRQTIDKLADKEGYCCLGVLCEVAIKNGFQIVKEFDEINSRYQYDGNYSDLPDQLLELFEEAGIDELRINGSYAQTLNDSHGCTFEEIAGMIEKYGVRRAVD